MWQPLFFNTFNFSRIFYEFRMQNSIKTYFEFLFEFYKSLKLVKRAAEDNCLKYANNVLLINTTFLFDLKMHCVLCRSCIFPLIVL